MEASGMRRFWEAAGVTVRQGDVILDLGCGLSDVTRDLAERAAHVVALDPSREAVRRARERGRALNNVTWLVGDGRSLAGVGDASLDGAVSPALLVTLPDAKRVLGYVEELGRVLRPGGWAAFVVSTDPRAGEPVPPLSTATSRRQLLTTLGGRRPPPRAARRPRGAAVPLDALGAVATAAGLALEQIEGAGTRRTVVRATRSPGA